MTRPLEKGYHADIDTVDVHEWYDQVAGFRDASLFQLWHHGSGQRGFAGVSRLLLRHDGDVVAAAEARLFRLPLVGRGIAYVLWGPICRHPTRANPQAFGQAIRAMRNEYVKRRGLVLRIKPRLLAEQHANDLRALTVEGFSPVEHAPQGRSLIVDLGPDIEQMRRDLDKKWRNCLSKAERSGLGIQSGTGLDVFDQFVGIYQRMLDRKQFVPSADIRKHRRIQQELPERFKMQVVLATLEGAPCAGAIYSAIGDTAVYLFGATDEAGMRTSACLPRAMGSS